MQLDIFATLGIQRMKYHLYLHDLVYYNGVAVMSGKVIAYKKKMWQSLHNI